MNAWTFLIELNKEWNCVPSSEKKLPISSSQIKRMLENKAVTFNGTKLGPKDEVQFPILELVFFKGSKSQCTLFGVLAETWIEWHSRVFPNCDLKKSCSKQHLGV